MRAALFAVLAAVLSGCSGGLTQRQPLAEVPIGTAATPVNASSSESSDSSSSGMVAAKIDETEAKKPAPKVEPASAKPRGGASKKGTTKRH
jgi:hypothetical protein